MSIKSTTFNCNGSCKPSWCSFYAAPARNSWLHFTCQTHINIVDGRKDDGMQHVHFIFARITLPLRRVARARNRCKQKPVRVGFHQQVRHTEPAYTPDCIHLTLNNCILRIRVKLCCHSSLTAGNGSSSAKRCDLPTEGTRMPTAGVTAAQGNIVDLHSVFLCNVCFQYWMDNGADESPGKASFLARAECWMRVMFCLEANCGNKKHVRRTSCQHIVQLVMEQFQLVPDSRKPCDVNRRTAIQKKVDILLGDKLHLRNKRQPKQRLFWTKLVTLCF